MVIAVSGRPAYLQVSDDLRSQIRAGVLAPGDSLPSTSVMVSRYGVSTTVVRQAISVLRSEGLVQGQQGKGVFVCESLPPINEADQDDEFRALLAGLNAVTSRVDQLTERITRLEDSLFPDGEPQPR